jgi:hypothetical protein
VTPWLPYLPYLLGGGLLIVMAWVAAVDELHRRRARDWERRQVQRSITDLECWLERAERRERAIQKREAAQVHVRAAPGDREALDG